MSIVKRVEALGGRLDLALEAIPAPLYVLDRNGTIIWLNAAGRQLVGDVVGSSYKRVVAPDHLHAAREQLARKLVGAKATDFELDLIGVDGRRQRVRLISGPLYGHGNVVGVFGFVVERARGNDTDAAEPWRPRLTPRQDEALRLLAEGLSTREIAARLGVADETARNHIRAVLRELGARSRLEAVVTASRLGLL